MPGGSNAGDQTLVNGNIVKISKTALQLLKCGFKFRLPPDGFFGLKQPGEKLGRVAQFFHANAQFVAFAGIEFCKSPPPLTHLAALSPQLFCRESFYRNLAPTSHQIISWIGPSADLKPRRNLEDQAAKSRRYYGVLCPGQRPLVLACDRFRK